MIKMLFTTGLLVQLNHSLKSKADVFKKSMAKNIVCASRQVKWLQDIQHKFLIVWQISWLDGNFDHHDIIL